MKLSKIPSPPRGLRDACPSRRVSITSRMHRSLYLHNRPAAFRGNKRWKLQVCFASRPPATILDESLTCFVPALYKIVMNVYRGWTCKLEVDVMIVPLTAMARRNHGIGIEIDPAHERRFICRGIDNPALLVLAKARTGAVPPDLHARSTAVEQFDMRRRSPEGVLPEPRGLLVGSPENDPHIDTSGSRTIKDIKWSSATVRHHAGLPHECDRYPDAPAGCLDRFADAPERRLTVNQRSHQIPAACWIRA